MSKRKRQGKLPQQEQTNHKAASTLRQMKLRRAAATVSFAAVIFASCLLPALHLECTAAVASGCLLGAMQGAGAAGLCAIAYLVKTPSPTPPQVATLAGTFLAALVSGLLSFLLQGAPLKHLSPKEGAKSLAACALGFAAFYVCQAVFQEDFAPSSFLAFDALKCVAAAVASAALRPHVHAFLFPRDKLEDEMTEMTAKLKKR